MNITLISWDNLGYISLIEKEMKSQGHTVRHINMSELKYEYPNVFYKGLNAVAKTVFNFNLKREILAKRVHQKLNQLPQQDVILLVSADWLPINFIKQLKAKTHRLIAWFYDASSNYPRIPKMIAHLDEVYTFEKSDAEKYNLNFLPNFNPHQHPVVLEDRQPYVFHVSSDRRDREFLLTKIAKQLHEHKIDYNIHLISQQPQENNFISISKTPIPLQTTYELLRKATIQIDIQRERQQGLSFRIFEAMGLQQKIITTNQDVISYDFYDSNNILVVDENNIDISDEFLNKAYEPISEEIFQKYTIENWVKRILD